MSRDGADRNAVSRARRTAGGAGSGRRNALSGLAGIALAAAGLAAWPARGGAAPERVAACDTVVSERGRQAVARRLDEWRRSLEKHRVALERIGRLADFAAVIEQADAAWRAGDMGAAYDCLTAPPARRLWRAVESDPDAPHVYVDGAAGDDARSGLGDWTNAVQSIAVGLKKAGPGCMVLVAPGRYRLASELVIEKNVILRSWKDGDVDPDHTVLDGQGRTRCVYLDHSAARVAGFTLTGGNGAGMISRESGGAVFIYTRGGTLSDCRVCFNAADLHGGGVILYSDNARLERCVVDCNRVTNVSRARGAGIYIASGGTVAHSTVAGNTNLAEGAYSGGGLYIRGEMNPERCRVLGCVISNNQACCGAGIQVYGTAVMESNTVVRNRAVGRELVMGGGVFMYMVRWGAVFAHNTVSDNAAGTGGGVFVWPSIPGEVSRGIVGGVAIRQCALTGNTAASSGGGLSVFIPGPNYAHTRVCVAGCDISGNRLAGTHAGAGAGVQWDAPGLLERCVIADNRADGGRGGGLSLKRTHALGAPEALVVRNCLVAGNSAGAGAGLVFTGCHPGAPAHLESCTVAGNRAAVSAGGVLIERSTGAALTNTIVACNEAPAHADLELARAVASLGYCCAESSAEEGSTGLVARAVSGDPGFRDARAGDFRLARESPCVDAGINQPWMAVPDAVDLRGAPRVRNGTVDVGCFELDL